MAVYDSLPSITPSDKFIHFWNIETGEKIKTLVGHTGGVREISISPDREKFASCSDDETIILWDLKKCLPCRILSNKPYAGMNISGVLGINDIDKATLKALGAVEEGVIELN